MKLTKSDFQIATLEDELRVDGLCRELLMTFYDEQLASGCNERSATQLANSADYYVRDYLIGVRQLNLLEPEIGEVRKFAGNWYIVNTLEPIISEIEIHLQGIREFYRFLCGHGAIDASFCATIEQECSELDFYQDRVDTFWGIKGDGYYQWESECSLK